MSRNGFVGVPEEKWTVTWRLFWLLTIDSHFEGCRSRSKILKNNKRQKFYFLPRPRFGQACVCICFALVDMWPPISVSFKFKVALSRSLILEVSGAAETLFWASDQTPSRETPATHGKQNNFVLCWRIFYFVISFSLTWILPIVYAAVPLKWRIIKASWFI